MIKPLQTCFMHDVSQRFELNSYLRNSYFLVPNVVRINFLLWRFNSSIDVIIDLNETNENYSGSNVDIVNSNFIIISETRRNGRMEEAK